VYRALLCFSRSAKSPLRRAQLVVVITVMLGASLIAFAAAQSKVPSAFTPRGLGNGYVSIDSHGVHTSGQTTPVPDYSTGWLVPAQTIISTSYTTSVSLSGFLIGSLDIIYYQLPVGDQVHLGLYVNGQLAATNDATLQNPSSGGRPFVGASVVGSVENGVANFKPPSSDLVSVAKSPLATAISPGSVLTMTVWTSSPIWVRIAPSAPVFSYETAMASYSFPSSIPIQTGQVGPHTLDVVFVASE